MNKDSIKIFNNPQFGDIRIVEIEGKPYFVGIDVAKALGYKRPNDAIAAHCRCTVKYRISDNQGIPHDYLCITQGDTYRLAAKSELPGAETFESWIFDEVLVSVSNHGAYMTPQKIEEALLNPDVLIQLATNLKTEQQKRIDAEQKLEEQRTKVLYADAVVTSQSSCLIADLAKILQQNGIDIGQNRLFEWMREHKYLGKYGDYYNMPTQRSIELGLFELKRKLISLPGGFEKVTYTPKVTGKGQIYFVNKFLNNNPD